MAFFGVTVEKIETVWAHPNADRLELAKLQGLAFQFVIAKGQYKPGDDVLYFPLDSELPSEIHTKMGLTGKLAGSLKNRVKTVKLRGEISQGVVGSLSLLPESLHSGTPAEITAFFGVTKYDPPPIISTSGDLVSLPEGYSVYDIEGADRFGDMLGLLKAQECVVLEKLEGTNFSVAIDVAGQIHVNQRNHSIIEKDGPENLYWKAARESGLIDWLKSQCSASPQNLCVYGELCGPKIQSNIYSLPSHTVYVFDVKREFNWVPWNEVEALSLPAPLVPVLFKGYLDAFLGGRSVQQASNGQSTLSAVLQEGIVIKPLAAEQRVLGFGRLILKQRSPEYLATAI